jgi:nicotinamidase-related amidase
MILSKSDVLLLVIDIQEKLIEKIHDYKQIIDVTQSVIDVFAYLKLPIIYSEQYPKGLGSTIYPLKNKLQEYNSNRIEKTSFSCLASFNENDIKSKFFKKQILICGIEAHICVLQTALDLIGRGFEVFVLNESIGSRHLSHKNAAVQRMSQSGVSLINFEMFLFELIRDSKSKDFKSLSRFINK